MKKTTLVFGICFVLFLICIIIFFVIFTSGDFEESSLNSGIPIVNEVGFQSGDCAVINIWIDSFSRLDVLRQHKIKYLFVDVGDTGKDGKLKTPENEIKYFLDFIHNYETEKGYNFVILPYSELITDDYDITSETFKQNFVNDYVRLSNMGFDGLLVDIEKIDDEEEDDYLDLLGRLNSNLGDNAVIAVYAGALSDSDNPWEWDYDFYKSVSEHTNIISAPLYDSDMPDEKSYKEYVENQINLISSAGFKSKFLFGIPTHKEHPETVENALAAYTESLEPNDSFLGVCIFAEWTADSNEWSVFEKYINK